MWRGAASSGEARRGADKPKVRDPS